MTGVVGGVLWMAPEVLSDAQDYTNRADIWSAGCVAIEMWTGQRPWYGKGLFAVMMAVGWKIWSWNHDTFAH
jgi:serine/threonine protein kinase